MSNRTFCVIGYTASVVIMLLLGQIAAAASFGAAVWVIAAMGVDQ